MKTIKPAKNQVFAKPTETKKQTNGGLFIAEDSMEKPRTAEVISVGSSVDWLNSGDTIVYKLYTTTDIKLEDTDYMLIAEEDVLGVVTDGPN